MTFSYNGAGSGPVGAVRFAIGDTVEKTALISDEDIRYLLRQTGDNVRAAALLACEGIIAQLSRLCDQTVGSVSKSFSQQRDGYQATYAILKARSSSFGGRPFAGGISRSQEVMQERNPDRLKPQFTTRMMQQGTSRYNAGRDVGLVSGLGVADDD